MNKINRAINNKAKLRKRQCKRYFKNWKTRNRELDYLIAQL